MHILYVDARTLDNFKDVEHMLTQQSIKREWE